MNTEDNHRPRESLRAMIVASAVILFASSALRHALFRSTLDFATFDQAVFLISRGEAPISSFLKFHILGDHAAWIFYPLALLYRLYPTAYWLLAVQALALALGAWPVFQLARDAGLESRDARLMAATYLLYPVLFNANLNDFRPETLALPAILGAVLAARRDRVGWFLAAVAVVLGCKEVLSLTLAAMGAWLFLWERRRLCGGIAAALGVLWFVAAAWWIIPLLSGADATRGQGYAYLGSSIGEIIVDVATHPWILVGHIVSVSSLGYLAGLLSPFLWGLVPGHLAPLLGATPTVALNVLSDNRLCRHLTNWYSLPVLPFLVLAALGAYTAGRTWVRKPGAIFAWCAIAFLAFARYPRLYSYLETTDTWGAERAAVAAVPPQAAVLTDECFAPHVSHRRMVWVIPYEVPVDVDRIPSRFEYVVINTRHPCQFDPDDAEKLARRIERSGDFATVLSRDGVVVFSRPAAAVPAR